MGKGPISLPLLTWASWMTDHLTWRVFKDSKKNEGLSGAAVFSDSVIMPLKILIVLAVCIRQLWGSPTQPSPTWSSRTEGTSCSLGMYPPNEEEWAHAGC